LIQSFVLLGLVLIDLGVSSSGFVSIFRSDVSSYI